MGPHTPSRRTRARAALGGVRRWSGPNRQRTVSSETAVQPQVPPGLGGALSGSARGLSTEGAGRLSRGRGVSIRDRPAQGEHGPERRSAAPSPPSPGVCSPRGSTPFTATARVQQEALEATALTEGPTAVENKKGSGCGFGHRLGGSSLCFVGRRPLWLLPGVAPVLQGRSLHPERDTSGRAR